MFVEAIFKTARSVPLTSEELIEDYFDQVYRFASRRLGREDAEDATIETLQVAINQIHRLKSNDPLPWILGIARRKVANYLRKSARRKEEPLREEVPSNSSHSLLKQENSLKLREIILDLPEDQRDALLLQHLEGLSVSQIAVAMQRSEASVTGLLYRARTTAFQKGKSYFINPEERK